MAREDLVYKVGVDASDAVSGLKRLEGAVKGTMREVEDELDDSATAGDKFAASIDRLSAQMREDFNSATIAAEELQNALKRAGSSLEVGDAIAELSRMGISFDEITQDADKFATSLKQLDDVRLEGVKELDSVAPGLATKLDDVNKSADSSKGALANMVGNSAQDLGELGGIAGSAGVAIGQMAEYFADAAFEGEGLGSVLKNFAAVAGPIALLSAGVAILSAGVQAYNKPAEEAAKRTEELGTAMAEGGDDALAFADVLRENASALSDFIADANDPLGGFGTWVDEVASKVPLVGGFFKEAGTNIFDASKRAGLSLYSLGKQIDGTGESSEAFHDRLQAAADAGKITGDEMRALEEAMRKYGNSANDAAKKSGLLAVSTDEVNAIIAESSDPLTHYVDKWNVLFDDLADGKADTQAATDAINFLSDALGMSPQDVVAAAQEHLNKAYDDSVEAAKAAADAQEEATKAAKEHRIALAGANDELVTATSAFAEMGRRAEAIRSVFDFGNAPLDAASATRDIAEAIGGLAETAKGVKVGDILAGNMKGDAVLDALDSLRPQIQSKIADAFAAGGPEAAQATADQYVDQIVKSLGGKLNADQVKELLGLTDLTAMVAVALDLSTLARVRTMLDILTGLNGETPLTASIALALDAKTITPEAAEVLVRAQLGQTGVTLPTDVTPPSPESIAEAGAFVTSFAAKDPPTIPTELDTAGAEKGAQGFADSKQPAATVPLEADTKPAEDKRKGFVDKTEATKPIVAVDANTKAAIDTMVLLKILAVLLAPQVTVTANTEPAVRAIAGIRGTSVPIDTYLDDVVTAQEIRNRIGPVRVPIDVVVGQTVRITGVRE